MRNIFDKRPNNGVSTKRQRSVPNAPVGEKIPNGKFYVVVAQVTHIQINKLKKLGR